MRLKLVREGNRCLAETLGFQVRYPSFLLFKQTNQIILTDSRLTSIGTNMDAVAFLAQPLSSVPIRISRR